MIYTVVNKKVYIYKHIKFLTARVVILVRLLAVVTFYCLFNQPQFCIFITKNPKRKNKKCFPKNLTQIKF